MSLLAYLDILYSFVIISKFWEQELKNWISAAKKDESIFSEIDLKSWNELGERVI
jgi:hypothetical protein